MKKLLTILIALGLVASLAACGNKKPVESGEKSGEKVSGEQLNTEGAVLVIPGTSSDEYAWSVTNYDSNIVSVEGIGTEKTDEYEETKTLTSFRIKGIKEGSTTIVFDYYRPSDGAESSIETKEYMATVDNVLNVVVVEKASENENPTEDDYTASADMQNLVDTLVDKSKVTFRMAMSSKIMKENAPTFIGLSEDVFDNQVVDSVVYEPMISPATSSMCIVKVSDTANVTELKQTIIDNCDPAKWICTSAEKCLAIDSGNYILLIMSSADDCEAMKNAFTEHFGANNVGKALTKDGDRGAQELPSE